MRRDILRTFRARTGYFVPQKVRPRKDILRTFCVTRTGAISLGAPRMRKTICGGLRLGNTRDRHLTSPNCDSNNEPDLCCEQIRDIGKDFVQIKSYPLQNDRKGRLGGSPNSPGAPGHSRTWSLPGPIRAFGRIYTAAGVFPRALRNSLTYANQLLKQSTYFSYVSP